MLSLEVQTMLGLITASSPAENTTKITTIKPAAEPEQKYMFGARS